MSSINLIKVLWSFVTIEKLQYFLSRHNRVKITVNKKDWHMTVKFFENVNVIYLKDVALNFF